MNGHTHGYYTMADGEDKYDTFPGKDAVDLLKGLSIRNILEIGCGTGAISEVLDAHYTGVDISHEAIEKGCTRHPDAVFAVSDSVPFPTAGFDAVLMYNSLEHFIRPRYMLKEAVRVLRDGGYLLILCPNHERLLYYRTLAPRAFRHHSYIWQAGWLVRHIWFWFLRKLGLTIFEVSGANIFDQNGLYGKPDDDLRHMVHPDSVTRFLAQQGLEKIAEPVRKRDMWMALFRK